LQWPGGAAAQRCTMKRTRITRGHAGASLLVRCAAARAQPHPPLRALQPRLSARGGHAGSPYGRLSSSGGWSGVRTYVVLCGPHPQGSVIAYRVRISDYESEFIWKSPISARALENEQMRDLSVPALPATGADAGRRHGSGVCVYVWRRSCQKQTSSNDAPCEYPIARPVVVYVSGE